MFCEKCGAQVEDGQPFCPNCGNRLGASQNAQQVKPAASNLQKPANPIMTNLLSQLRGFFSRRPTDAIDSAVGSTGLEWLIYLGCFVILGALSMAVTNAEKDYDFFGRSFGFGLLAMILYNAVVFGGIAFYVYVIQRKRLPIMSVLNLTELTFLPVIIVYVLNMLLGVIWSVLVEAAILTAIVMQVFFIIAALRKLDDNGEVNVLYFALVAMATIFLYMLFRYLFVDKLIIEGGIKAQVKNAFSGFNYGDIGNWFG